MFNFQYEIKTNEKGRPFIDIYKDQTDHPEHKFMALEITRYLLNELLKDNEKVDELSESDVVAIANSGYLLEQIADRFASMIKEQNNALGELDLDIEDE